MWCINNLFTAVCETVWVTHTIKIHEFSIFHLHFHKYYKIKKIIYQ